jgi:hypothetical protein
MGRIGIQGLRLGGRAIIPSPGVEPQNRAAMPRGCDHPARNLAEPRWRRADAGFQGGTRAYGFRGRLEVATTWPCLVIDSGGRSILLSLNPRAEPKVKDAFLGSDICHAFRISTQGWGMTSSKPLNYRNYHFRRMP